MSLVPDPPAKRGGQLKLNPKRLAAFTGYIANGMTFASACRATGIGDQTRRDWQRRGRLELTRLADQGTDPATLIDPTEEGWPTPDDWVTPPPAFDPDAWPFVVFAVATEKALVSFEARMLTVVQSAATTSWQAAAWMLERRFPEMYSRPEVRVKVEAADPRQDADAVVSADDVEAKFAELEEQQAKRGQQ